MLKYDKLNKYTLIVGIGSGTYNLLNYINLNNGYDSIDFLAIGTEKQALFNLNIPQNRQLLLKKEITNKTEIGEKPEYEKELRNFIFSEIESIIVKDYKLVFILLDMNGTTEICATPIIAEIFRNSGYLVITIVLRPKILNGKLSKEKLKKGMQLIYKSSDVAFMFSHNRIPDVPGGILSPEILSYVGSIFKMPIDAIMEMVIINSAIGINFDDLKNLIREVNGLAIAISGISKGADRIEKALSEMYSSPYLSGIKIKSANKMLLFFESGTENEITMPEMGVVIDSIQNEIGKNITITFGNGINTNRKDEIKISAIFTGEFEY